MTTTDTTPLIVKHIQKYPEGLLHYSPEDGPVTGTSGRSFLAELDIWRGTPAEVWVAVDMYPESMEVKVGRSEAEVLRKIVHESIGEEAFNEFVATLKGDEKTDVVFSDTPEHVIRVWAGDKTPMEEGEGYYIGEEWAVRRVLL